VTINDTTNIVARLELDLILNIKVDDTHDTVGCKQVGERVDHRMELGNHGKTVAHGQEICTDMIGCTAFVESALANAEYCTIIIVAVFVVAELEGTSILANDFDVLPAEAGESSPGDLAEGWREVDKVDCVEEAGDREVFLHLFNVPASTSTDVLQAAVQLAR
jgi:hypothetical protein